MKKTLLFLINLIGISFYTHALIISEVMYDPQGSDTGREWIEVYNDTSSGVDLSSWKFFESGTNHSIVANQGGVIISPNLYAVIADNPIKFLSDYPNFSGILFDSSFSLSNSGEHIALKESSSGPEINFIDYNPLLGGNDDGSTLSFIDGIWTRGEATPANANKASVLEIVSTTTKTTENQATITQMSPPTADIVFYMPFEKTVVAGAEAEFSTYGMTRSGKNIEGLICDWAFGDGGRATGTSTKYIYAYPGKYIAQVEGTNGYVAGKGRVNVRVVPPDILIEKIDKGKYGTYVDIKNPNTYDLDLSQWKLLINEQTFPFPKNTLVAGNTITHLSGMAMGFASTTPSLGTEVRILFPNLEEITKYVVQPYITNATSTISNINLNSKQDKIVTTTKNKEIIKTFKAVEATTSSSTIKIVNNKNIGIANWLRKLFNW